MISSEAFRSVLFFHLYCGQVCEKGAEMDLIACAFRSDEMVHCTFWRVEVIVTVSLPSLSSVFGYTETWDTNECQWSEAVPGENLLYFMYKKYRVANLSST